MLLIKDVVELLLDVECCSAIAQLNRRMVLGNFCFTSKELLNRALQGAMLTSVSGHEKC